MADRLAEECPGKELSILAYIGLMRPPQIMTRRPKLHVWFYPIRSNCMYPIADPHNHGYLDQLRGWIEKMPPLSVNCFEYYGWKPLLTPFLSKMKQDLDSYHALGVGGIYGWCGFTYNLMGTQYRWSRDLFGLTRLMWNRGCDLNQAEREWAEGVFGEGAPEVLEFYRLLREQHRKECEIGLRDSGPWISMELLRRLMVRFQPARDKNLTEKTAEASRSAGTACRQWRDLRDRTRGAVRYSEGILMYHPASRPRNGVSVQERGVRIMFPEHVVPAFMAGVGIAVETAVRTGVIRSDVNGCGASALRPLGFCFGGREFPAGDPFQKFTMEASSAPDSIEFQCLAAGLELQTEFPRCSGDPGGALRDLLLLRFPEGHLRRVFFVFRRNPDS